MGYGDALMATGEVLILKKKFPNAKFVIGDGKRSFWSEMFENNPDILELYLNNFKYILVDEYQDSNYIQSKWLNLLAKKKK